MSIVAVAVIVGLLCLIVVAVAIGCCRAAAAARDLQRSDAERELREGDK